MSENGIPIVIAEVVARDEIGRVTEPQDLFLINITTVVQARPITIGMEELTKQQLILLALLVSFVTSIATGIATVSLLDQAPPQVTRVINRVVERTVETVTPSNQTASAVNTVTKEETIVVREDELITESITKASRGIVRVVDDQGDVQAFGFVLSKDGTILASTENISNSTLYNIVLPGGIKTRARVVNRYPEENVATLTIENIPEEVVLTPLVLASGKTLQLGSSVLVISGTERNQVSMGIISRFEESQGSDAGSNTITGIYTNIVNTEIAAGTPLLNLFGEVIGVRLHAGEAVFTPVGVLAPALASQS